MIIKTTTTSITQYLMVPLATEWSSTKTACVSVSVTIAGAMATESDAVGRKWRVGSYIL